MQRFKAERRVFARSYLRKGKEELSINLVGSVRQDRRYTDLVSSSVIHRRNTRASFAGEPNVDGSGREADE